MERILLYIPNIRNGFSRVLGWTGSILSRNFPDLLTLIGLALLTIGFGFIYFPLALIILGSLLIFAGYRIECNRPSG